MRTTIDLPDDLHRAAAQIARDRHQTLSRTVASLLRSALAGESGSRIEVDEESGLPTVHVGEPITAEDVAAADDA
ncbi:MAG: antitoxin [Actinobacteria bacterium]|nr:antitoxin [Actinomycetota bacterium]